MTYIKLYVHTVSAPLYQLQSSNIKKPYSSIFTFISGVSICDSFRSWNTVNTAPCCLKIPLAVCTFGSSDLSRVEVTTKPESRKIIEVKSVFICWIMLGGYQIYIYILDNSLKQMMDWMVPTALHLILSNFSINHLSGHNNLPTGKNPIYKEEG